jgi:hypothetical protein
MDPSSRNRLTEKLLPRWETLFDRIARAVFIKP